MTEETKPATAKRISDVPTDRLAANFVGTLIQTAGNINKWDALSVQLITTLREEFARDIDTERAARLAAEARVKVLQKELRKWSVAEVYRPIYGGGTARVGWRCRVCLSDWDTPLTEKHENGCLLNGTVIKEPANG